MATLLLAAFSGCMTITVPKPGSVLAHGTGGTVVVGRVQLMTAWGEIHLWDDAKGWPGLGALMIEAMTEELQAVPPAPNRPVFGIFDVARNLRTIMPPIENEGWFCWQLQPGTYLFYTLSTVSGGEVPDYVPAPGFTVLAALRVPASTEPVYTGTVRVDLGTDWQPGERSAIYHVAEVSVLDERFAAAPWLAARNPETRLSAETSQFVADPRLSGLFDSYSPARTRRVLDSLGLGP